MKLNIYKEFLILAVLFFGGWVGFSYLTPDTVEPIEVTLSVENEKKIGEIIVKDVLNTYTQANDSVVVTAIDEITSHLLKHIESSQYEYSFYVLDSPEVNAFATFGGHIFIYSGLIDLTENPEELAAVLAHEIGHVEQKHVSKMLVRKLGLSIITSILTGGDPAVVTEVLEMSLSSSFSRHSEKEADDFGLNLLEKAHINPKNMGYIFSKLSELEKNQLIPNITILSSHPNTEERAIEALNYHAKNLTGDDDIFNHIDWDDVKLHLP